MLWGAIGIPGRRRDSYKGKRGHLMVVSGGPVAYGRGAALRRERGLRVGAGLVTMLSPPERGPQSTPRNLEAVMLKAFTGRGRTLATSPPRRRSVVIGPAAGVGEATRANLLALANSDAGAWSWTPTPSPVSRTIRVTLFVALTPIGT